MSKPMDEDFERLALDHNPDALVMTDAKGCVQHWNAVAQDLSAGPLPRPQACRWPN